MQLRRASSGCLIAQLAIALGMAAAGQAAPAQPVEQRWYERVYVLVPTAKPGDTAGTPQVRGVEVALPADRFLPKTLMPKFLAEQTGQFRAWIVAQVVVAADDRQTACHVESGTLRLGGYSEGSSETPLSMDICPLLRQSVRLRHAIDLNGKPIAATTKVSVIFDRIPASDPPPPALAPPKTSGHVLDEQGQWTDPDGAWWASYFTIASPNWSVALADRRDLPTNDMVGVFLKLSDDKGQHKISCEVVIPGKDKRLNAATCQALSASSWSGEYARNMPDSYAYPMTVRWQGEKAEMSGFLPPEVPHMPDDVHINVADVPRPPFPEKRAITLRMSLDERGRATRCTVMGASGNDAWDSASCRLALEKARFTAALDWFGRPARGEYDVVVDWDYMVIRPVRS